MPWNPHGAPKPYNLSTDEDALSKFLAALRTVYNADVCAVQHITSGTIDFQIIPKPLIFSKQICFTINENDFSTGEIDKKIKQLNGSRELFDQFITFQQREGSSKIKSKL